MAFVQTTSYVSLFLIFLSANFTSKRIKIFRCCQVHDECYERIMNDPELCTFSSSVYWKIYTRDDTCTGCGKFDCFVLFIQSALSYPV